MLAPIRHTTALTVLLAFVSTTATAQSYPERPITIVVPAAAGGPSDTVARLIAQSLTATLGQQVLIENMGGAGGSLGAGRAARSEPDGYTLYLYHVGTSTFTTLYPDLGYDPIEAFAPIGLITEVPMAVVVRADDPVQDIAGFLEVLRADGSDMTFATAGIGSASDLCGMLLAEALATEFVVVPYQGTGPAMTDFLGGAIDFMCDQTTNNAGQIAAGDLRPLAVTTRQRIELFPKAPTLAESGLENFEVTAWHGLWSVAGTPPAVIERLSAALQEAVADPALAERFAQLGTVPVAPDLAVPRTLDERLRTETNRWSQLIAASGAAPR